MGNSIRKQNWLRILDEFPDIGMCIKRNVKAEYMIKIKTRVEKAKRDYINKVS
jgi:hypothetical protein